MKPLSTKTSPLLRFRAAWQLSPAKRGLLPVEMITLLYGLFTTGLLLACHRDILHPETLLLQRASIAGAMLAFYVLHRLYPCEATRFLRCLFPLTLLGYWYPDTFEFCQIYPNLDHLFAESDQILFDCQPSVEFSAILPEKAWSELFHMGYFSYYPLIFLTVLLPLLRSRRLFERTAFVVLVSFFLYYLIFLFLPVAGPQYYFQAIGPDCVQQGYFPHIGHYFRTHQEMLPDPGPEGFFRGLVEYTQASGERPTAAFPSSHVGISTILMLLLVRNGNRRAAWVCLPFYLVLCASTVYIQAHYLIDVLGGLASAFLFYALALTLYPRLRRLGGH